MWGLSALDVIRKGPADLRDKTPLILGIAESPRGELCGTEIEIGAGELRMLAHEACCQSTP